jgi:predicted nuclease with TOPRIM domain
MQSVQESKQELEAAIRYAENAISSANQTIESMEFRQEMAKKQYAEQTGREQALQEERDMLEKNVKYLRDENERLKRTISELEDKVQGQYDDIVMLQRDVEFYTKEYNKLVQQKEASSGPCGCQAYRDLEERATMPVIPKAVAIAIFREGVAHGVSNACDELDNATDIEISETGYTGGFEVSFTKYFDLSEHLDLDWMRDKVGDYDEASVIEALKNLCADKEFECRIHGVDDQEEKKND